LAGDGVTKGGVFETTTPHHPRPGGCASRG
jgi:hypothetical protein